MAYNSYFETLNLHPRLFTTLNLIFEDFYVSKVLDFCGYPKTSSDLPDLTHTMTYNCYFEKLSLDPRQSTTLNLIFEDFLRK